MKKALGDQQEQHNKLLNPSASSSELLSNNLHHNLSLFLTKLGNSSDVMVRHFSNSSLSSKPLALIYIDGMVNIDTVNQMILEPLLQEKERINESPSPAQAILFIQQRLLPVGNLSSLTEIKSSLSTILEGNLLLLVDGVNIALTANVTGYDKRSITEPTTQTVIRGPKEAFTESLRTGTSMIRRKIKNEHLRIEELKIGKQTQTSVAMIYLDGIANDLVVEEIRSRLSSIDTDSILESNYIEEFIQDSPRTPFPTIQNTERPDSLASGILEGQIGIMIEGTPFALLAPFTFFSFFQSSEDYYQRYDVASFLRILRFFAFCTSLLLPALFIAVTTFHQDMLPTALMISLASQREGVPFSALFEGILMELAFDILREASVRMPRAISSAISIVGALVLGQAAVEAGFISAAMVIIVSISAISNLVIPSQSLSNSIRLLRYVMMLAAGVLGLYGIMSLVAIILAHLLGLRSFGVPYLSPVAPLKPQELKDVLIRKPIWSLGKRPYFWSRKETKRQGTNQKPGPKTNKHKEE
ncbi:spore germination protein [Paenibacillus sp. Marseille-Q4541]|uniref:spore germination protein n=1 Tax=Paenibacillus sp. Marseille-Q4541 TaxID=2831522 RepID=UPI002018BDA6|nr:spore germination protein [Paenibacillus sp. Marseille-Q4541]